MELADLLDKYTKTSLLSMARHLGLSELSNDHAELTRAIIEAMNDPDAVRLAYAGLTLRERRLLEFVQLHGGSISILALRALAFREKISLSNAEGSSSQIKPRSDSTVFEEQLAVLASRGLLLTINKKRDSLLRYEFKERAIIPEPVREHLPTVSLDTSLTPTTPPPYIRYGDAASFQRDLYLYWSYIRDNTVSVTTRGLIKKTQLKKINQTLSKPDALDDIRDETRTGRLRFLRECLLVNQFIQQEGNRLVVTPQSEHFFSKPLAERARLIFDGYRQNQFWNELLQIPCLVLEGDRINPRFAPELVRGARQKILYCLQTIRSQDWLTFEALEDFIRNRDYEFLFERIEAFFFGRMGRSLPYLYTGNSLGWNFYELREKNGERYAYEIEDEETGWDLVEAGFIAAVIAEPLAWMGLVDLGFEEAQDDGPDAVDTVFCMRLNELGAHLLLGTELNAQALQAQGRLIVQATFQVLHYPPISEERLSLLDRVAERVRVEQVAEYRLTRESLYRARQTFQLTAEQIIKLLEEASGEPLPQNVAYTLLEWGQAQERIRLYEEVMLFQVAQPELLDRLLAEPTSATLIARRLSPNLALVDKSVQAELEQALLNMGQLALVYDTPEVLKTGGDWIEIDSNGLITLKPQAPSVYLRPALRRFCLENQAGFLPNEALVRQAFADGLELDELLGQLRLWGCHELPKRLERQLYTWSGSPGELVLERPLLLKLENEQLAERLLHDPELAALLKPYRPLGTVLEVSADQLAQLKALLAERHISLLDRDEVD